MLTRLRYVTDKAMKGWKKRIKLQDGKGVGTGEAGQCTAVKLPLVITECRSLIEQILEYA